MKKSATMLSIPQLLFLIKVDIVLPNSSSVKGQSSSSIPMSKLFSGKSSWDTKLTYYRSSGYLIRRQSVLADRKKCFYSEFSV